MTNKIAQLCSEFDEESMAYGTLLIRRLWAKRLAELEGENARMRSFLEDGLCMGCGAVAVGAGVDRLAEEIKHLRDENERLQEVLSELVDLMQGVIEGDYKPDSFTLQPARQLLDDDEDE